MDKPSLQTPSSIMPVRVGQQRLRLSLGKLCPLFTFPQWRVQPGVLDVSDALQDAFAVRRPGIDGSQEDGTMRLEDHFGNGSILQRNERVKLAASFWNNIGAGMVIGGMAAAFFLDKPEGTWTKIGIAIAGLVLGWLCYSIASNILTYMHTVPEERR
jgi:hypothetical protein